MTATGPLVVNDPVDILTVTRKIFAASHWTAGSYAGLTPKDPESVDPPASGEQAWKPMGCAVGGLRYAAVAPMDHALDETWMYANFVAMGGNPLSGALAEEAAGVYLAALEYLAQVANPAAWEGYLLDRERRGDDDFDVWDRISAVEDIVVNWNDSSGYDADADDDEEDRLATVNGVILPAFDKAIEIATAAKAQPELDNTTEGS